MKRWLSVIAIFTGCVASAQEFRATLQGTVFDPGNAAVPGAQLTLRNVQTSLEQQTTANGQGHYVFQFLAPGEYSLTTQASGFKIDIRGGIQLSVADNVRLDVNLSLGQVTERVEVSANAVGVAVDTSSLGTLVQRQIIEDLPLKGHGSFDMFQLAPGIVSEDRYQDTRLVDQTTTAFFSANGAPKGTMEVTVDGVPGLLDLNRGIAVASYVPSSQSISEFKMETSTVSAEYGKTSGTVMNVVIKSGTNEIHGSAYEFHQNSALNANGYFANMAGQSLPPNKTNVFGGSVGGPVYIPKTYNGRNRTFFFASYEHLSNPQANTGSVNVATPKMQTGDFSELSTSIYNPYSTHYVGTVPTRDPFPGKQIPPSLIDPVGKAILSYMPPPNVTASGSPWQSNHIDTVNYGCTYGMWTWKFDQTVSTKQQVFLRLNYGSGWLESPSTADFNGIARSSGIDNTRPNRGFAIGDTYLLSSKVAADFRVGFSRGANLGTSYSKQFKIASLGFPPSFTNTVTQGDGFPPIRFSDGMASMGYSTHYVNWSDLWSTNEALTISTGRHLFKVGGQIRVLRGNWWNNSYPGGTFTFRPNESGGPNASSPSGGFSIASLLLGFGQGSVTTGSGQSWANRYYGLYFQDDLRVSRRLTLNVGLRWEYDAPRTERYDRSVRGFAYNAPSPLKVPGLSLTGGLLYAGVNGAPRGLYDPQYKHFSPRIGFAYLLSSNLAVRGGYNLMYVPVITSVLSTGYSQTTPWVSTTDGGITVANKLSNPFPNGQLPLIGNSQGLATLVGDSISYAEPNDITPTFHTWQISIQRSLPSRGLLSVAYVGSRGVHLKSSNYNINQVPSNYFSLGAGLSQTVPNPFYNIVASTSTIGGANIQNAQLLRPFPQFTAVTRLEPAYGNSHYNSLQVQYEKRTANGLTGVIALTIAKSIDDLNAPQNIADRQTSRALAAYDVPTRLTTALAWDVPLGRRRHFLPGINRVANLLIGDWELSTSQTIQGGMPLSFSVSGGTYFSNAIRPLVVGDPSQGVSGSIGSRLTKYFNTAALVGPPNFTLGNLAPRIGSVRTPGHVMVSATLGKRFPISDRVNLDFRVTAYNLPNHPVFGSPGTTVGSASYGIINSQMNYGRQLELVAKVNF